MVRMPEEKTKNHLHVLSRKSKRENGCSDEAEEQADETELEENIKDSIKRNVLKY